VELGQVDTVDAGEEEVVDSSAADDKSLFGPIALFQGVLNVVAEVGAGGLVVFLASDNDIISAGKDAADGFVGFAAHDDGMGHGKLLEAFEVFGQAPKEPVVFTDGAVFTHGDDNGKLCFQYA